MTDLLIACYLSCIFISGCFFGDEAYWWEVACISIRQAIFKFFQAAANTQRSLHLYCNSYNQPFHPMLKGRWFWYSAKWIRFISWLKIACSGKFNKWEWYWNLTENNYPLSVINAMFMNRFICNQSLVLNLYQSNMLFDSSFYSLG